jgi:hypothetical protein
MAISNTCILHTIIKTKKVSTPKFIQWVCCSLVLTVDDLTGIDNLHSLKTAHLSQKHFVDSVPLSDGKNKAQRKCNVHSDKEKYPKGKDDGQTHPISMPIAQRIMYQPMLQNIS